MHFNALYFRNERAGTALCNKVIPGRRDRRSGGGASALPSQETEGRRVVKMRV